jgi:TonB family protein
MNRFAAIVLSVLSLFSSSCVAGQKSTCAGLIPEPISCPTPRAPRITELKAGTVVVELTIRLDGTVENARIVSASGHPAWKDAVLQSAKEWRYKASDKPRSITVPFEMVFK